MANLQRLLKRYVELETEAAFIEATKRSMNDEWHTGYVVDTAKLIEWSIKVKHLISISCSAKSEHYRAFEQAYGFIATANSHDAFLTLGAIFKAAKDDFENGYITSIQAIVQAEVFSSELDQSRELLKGGYRTAAAVVAGVVLETGLRELCTANGIAPSKLNSMNVELTKAGVYTLLIQKRITALADIRNNAAHGHPDQFTEGDVADMIRQVEGFLADYL